MTKRSERPDGWDDGWTVADMDVEGMPWHDARRGKRPPGGSAQGSGERLDLRQRLNAYGGILAAVGLVSLAFGGAYFLLILLMDLAW